MPLPNFYLIGAPKSGTTSLYHYLKQHPEIYMCPVKEPSYFLFPEGKVFQFPKGLMAEWLIKNTPKRVFPTFEKYAALFQGVENEQVIGEASVHYLINPKTPEYIFNATPHAKFMAILRNPFDAAYSEFLMTRQDGEWLPGVTFLQLLQAEKLDESDVWYLPNFMRARFYANHLTRYFDTFPKEQIRIFLHEELQRPETLCKEIFQFLEVSTRFTPDLSKKYNVTASRKSRKPRSKFMEKTRTLIRKSINRVTPSNRISNRKSTSGEMPPTVFTKCPEEAKAFLRPVFTPEILKLQNMINRDLSNWLV